MRANWQNRVVFQETIQDVQRLTRATGNHLGAVDAILVGDVRIDPNGLVVVPVIAWVIGRQETASPDAKALRIRGREGARAMHGTQWQFVMPVDHLGTG